jgi:uncharacterized membrane protein YGL010W
MLLLQIEGAAIVHTIVYLIIFGLIFGLLFWLCDYLKLPEPFNKVVRVILVVGAVLLIINVLLAFVGHPIVKW